MNIRNILTGFAFASLFYSGMVAVSAADACKNPQSQQSINQCAALSYQASDKTLNQLFKQIEKRLGADQPAHKMLVEAQRAWLSYRDADCEFSASAVAGGSLYPLVYNQCLERLTKNRVAAFKNYLNCEEGDVSCPLPAAE